MRTSFFSFVLLVAMGTAPFAHAGPAASVKAWVPAGWKLIQDASGDLDGDGLDDAVLVLERTDPANIVANEGGLGTSELNLNPRRLLVLFQGPSGWRKGLQTDRFLPTEHDADSPCLADPLDEGGVTIQRGVLVIDLHYWLSCGSWAATHRSFRFRLEQGRFRLIGQDTQSFVRNTGEESASSINYLTGRKKTTETPMVSDEQAQPKPRTTWTHLTGPRTFYLDRMRAGD